MTSSDNYEKDFLANLGMRIAFLRKEVGMNQNELGEASGRMLNTISRIELGKVDSKITTLDAIARALDVPLKELVYFDPNSFIKSEFSELFIETARMLRLLDQDSLIIVSEIIKSVHKTTKERKNNTIK